MAAGETAEGVKQAQLGAYHRVFLWVVIFYAVGAIAALFVRDVDAAATMGPTIRGRMKPERQREIVRRLLALHDEKSTELAPEPLRNPAADYTSTDQFALEAATALP